MRLCWGEKGHKWMERDHSVDKMMAMWEVHVLERSLGGRICRIWWLFGSG